jgi:hypothetical protein
MDTASSPSTSNWQITTDGTPRATASCIWQDASTLRVACSSPAPSVSWKVEVFDIEDACRSWIQNQQGEWVIQPAFAPWEFTYTY